MVIWEGYFTTVQSFYDVDRKVGREMTSIIFCSEIVFLQYLLLLYLENPKKYVSRKVNSYLLHQLQSLCYRVEI